EGQQAGEQVVLNDLVGEVLEEQLLLFLVHVEAQVAYLAALQRLDGRLRVDERAPAGVDQHNAVAHLTERRRIDEVIGLRRERAVQRDDIRACVQLGQADILPA